jgi:hypothetical protein
MQKEIWSSRTTKKVAWSLGSVVVLLWIGLFLFRYWFNPLERGAVTKMLDRAVQIRVASTDDLPKQVALAKDDARTGEKFEWTMRDRVLESTGAGSMKLAELCRRGELKLQAPLDPREVNRITELTKFGCEQYEDDVKYSREALRTHLGF